MFSHYIILDFEATCEANKRIVNPEVIEFPFVIVDAQTHRMECEFRRYVKPILRPTLSSFCTQLTGITQATVNASSHFPNVYYEALSFLQERGFNTSCSACNASYSSSSCTYNTVSCRGNQQQQELTSSELAAQSKEKLGSHSHYCMVTCGDWDLQTMLPCQLNLCNAHNLSFPDEWMTWCNLKVWMRQHLQEIISLEGNVATTTTTTTTTTSTTNKQNYHTRNTFTSTPRITDLPDLLQLVNLSLWGKHHSGLDDCRNIARVVCALLDRGLILTPTTSSSKFKATLRRNIVHDVNNSFEHVKSIQAEQHITQKYEESLEEEEEQEQHKLIERRSWSSVARTDGSVEVYCGVRCVDEHAINMSTLNLTTNEHKSQIKQSSVPPPPQQQELQKQQYNVRGSNIKEQRKKCNHGANSETDNAITHVLTRTQVRIDTTRNAIHDILSNIHEESNVCKQTSELAEICHEKDTRSCKTHLSPAIERKVSHILSNILRHGADRMHIPISTNGFVNVNHLLWLAQVKRYNVDLVNLALLVQRNDKQRYTLCYGTLETEKNYIVDSFCNDSIYVNMKNCYKDNNYIREEEHIYIAANQGHSLPNVTPLLTKITSPYIANNTCLEYHNYVDNNTETNNAINANSNSCCTFEEIVAVHGTSLSAWEAIKLCGYLSPMGREHIHFALLNKVPLPQEHYEEQQQNRINLAVSGLRKNAEVWLYLNVALTLTDGIELWLSRNNVLLTCGEQTSRTLPLKYIQKAILTKTKTNLPL